MGWGRGIACVLLCVPFWAHAEDCQTLLAGKVSVFRTDVGQGTISSLVPQPDLQFKRPGKTASSVISVHPDQLLQRMNGFGGAMTESCAMNMDRLPEQLRWKALERLFSKSAGAGFDYIRLPISSTDFSDGTRPNYTYDDTPDGRPDPFFRYFDMSRDEKSFELIRMARTINPNLHVMITPWSPPAWMKLPQTMLGGSLNPKYYADFARYYVMVIRGLWLRGVPVASMTIQNEPGYPNNMYPSMGMSAEDQIRFLRDYLIPELSASEIPIGIYIYDHNWDGYDLVNQILDDPLIERSVEGIAYHCYNGDYDMIGYSNKKHPDIPTFQTECTDLLPDVPGDSFDWWIRDYSMGTMSLGSKGSMAWNLCLDEKGGPTNNGCETCAGMLTTDFSHGQPEFRYSDSYYAFAQISRFLRPGARRIATDPERVGEVWNAAFLNPDGQISFVTWNPDDQAVNLRVQPSSCAAFDYKLEGHSAVTFTWSSFFPVAAGS